MKTTTSQGRQHSLVRMSAILQAITGLLYGGIVLIILEAVRRGDVAAVVNGLVSLLVALLPLIAGVVGPALIGESLPIGAELPLWLAAAGLLHSYGMLGPYDSVPWWDVLTHTVSATLLAALVYAAFLVAVPAATLRLPAASVAPLTVAFTVLAGVFWELLELVARDLGDRFDVEPVLVHYGWRDTALDLLVDVLGAVIVVLLDVRIFLPLAEQFAEPTTILLLGSGAIVVAGSGVFALVLLRDRWLS